MQSDRVEWNRVGLFVALAFGLAWLIALYLYLDGARWDPAGGAIPSLRAVILLAVGYMSTPAIAHVLARVITREGWSNTRLQPNLRAGWKFWLLAWVLPAVLTVFGALVYFLLFPGLYDPELGALKSMMPTGALPPGFTPQIIILLQLVQAVLVSPLLNSVFTFGEEFGWRAYLLPKLLPLGPRRSMLLLGVIWGLWHAPLIAMGHNYGQSYPGWPVAGIIMMTIFCIAAGTVLAWFSLRGRSVWPAVIGHAALNGIAGIAILLTRDLSNLNMLLGPTPAGLVGGAGFLLLALILFITAPRWAKLQDHAPAGSKIPDVPA